MSEGFNEWNKHKQAIHARVSSPHCKKREVWWFAIGKNIGVEQSCKGDFFARPVLVIKTFGPRMFWGVPITTASIEKKMGSIFYYDISGQSKLKGLVVLSQLRTYDTKRLIRKIARIDNKTMKEINLNDRSPTYVRLLGSLIMREIV